MIGIVLGSFLSLAFIGYAYQLTLAPYAIALKRMSILFASVFGFVLLKEKNVKLRLIAALIMVAGTILIAFS